MSDDYQVSDEDVARVEEALKADIAWAIARGPGWDPHSSAMPVNGQFRAPPECGVCAIGAHVLHRGLQPQGAPIEGADIVTAAQSLGVPVRFIQDIYGSVMTPDDERDEEERATSGDRLGWRLRDWADAEQAKVKAAADTGKGA